MNRRSQSDNSGLQSILAENALGWFLGRDVEEQYLDESKQLHRIENWNRNPTDARTASPAKTAADQTMETGMSRRHAMKTMAASFLTGLAFFQTSCNPFAEPAEREKPDWHGTTIFRKTFA